MMNFLILLDHYPLPAGYMIQSQLYHIRYHWIHLCDSVLRNETKSIEKNTILWKDNEYKLPFIKEHVTTPCHVPLEYTRCLFKRSHES